MYMSTFEDRGRPLGFVASFLIRSCDSEGWCPHDRLESRLYDTH